MTGSSCTVQRCAIALRDRVPRVQSRVRRRHSSANADRRTPEIDRLDWSRGKTFLLAHTRNAEHVFLFTAARTTPGLNRQQIVNDLGGWRGEAFWSADFPTWRSVFPLLVDVATDRAAADVPLPLSSCLMSSSTSPMARRAWRRLRQTSTPCGRVGG